MRSFMSLAGFAVAFSSTVEAQTPPPLLARQVTPTAVVTATVEDLSKVAVSHPTPRYASEASRRHITGKGFYYLHISTQTGDVTAVEILTSAGHRVLDDAAVATLKLWKFRPHTVVGLKITFTFTSKT